MLPINNYSKLAWDLWHHAKISMAQAEIIESRLFLLGYSKQREGKWKLHDDGSGTCDQCNFRQKNVWDYDNWQNYCGCCGAKMSI